MSTRFGDREHQRELCPGQHPGLVNGVRQNVLVERLVQEPQQVRHCQPAGVRVLDPQPPYKNVEYQHVQGAQVVGLFAEKPDNRQVDVRGKQQQRILDIRDQRRDCERQRVFGKRLDDAVIGEVEQRVRGKGEDLEHIGWCRQPQTRIDQQMCVLGLENLGQRDRVVVHLMRLDRARRSSHHQLWVQNVSSVHDERVRTNRARQGEVVPGHRRKDQGGRTDESAKVHHRTQKRDKMRENPYVLQAVVGEDVEHGLGDALPGNARRQVGHFVYNPTLHNSKG
ncbi:hypothetical protein KL941_003297 [Ogataea angusta]|nr:hypothetical protein KL941_003297 [Ogataea angusta]